MPKENQDGQEKTEKPSSRRIRKSRGDGQVAKSQELNAATVLIAAFIGLSFFGSWIMQRLKDFMIGTYARFDVINIDAFNFRGYAAGAVKYLLTTVAPILIIVFITGIVINYLQFGFLWQTKTIQPKMKKLDPMKNIKNLTNQQAWVRLLFNILKLIVVASVAYLVIKSRWPQFIPLIDSTVPQIFSFLIATIVRVAIYTFSILLLIGIIDFTYQKFKHSQDLMMTKVEVKEERKQSEGDPKVKAKMREMQMKMAFNTMIKELPSADVVVTNPTHVAIALKYDPGTMDAPIVIGKGLRLLAQRIKQIAKDNNIPMVENKPLARALYKYCEVGDEIPGQFYQDVAEILAHIYELRQGVKH